LRHNTAPAVVIAATPQSFSALAGDPVAVCYPHLQYTLIGCSLFSDAVGRRSIRKKG
jgi:hypothetical protein